MKKSLILLTLAGVCAYALCSCRSRITAEQPLSAKETADLKQTLSQPAEHENIPADGAENSEDVSDEEDACYYIPGGSVFHGDPACHHIAGKGNVVKATVSEAFAAGKTRPCALCG